MAAKKAATARPEYHKWPRERPKVAGLFLDSANIRLQVPVKASPQTLINDLFVNENAMQVLESIAQNGYFPDEIPVVVRERNKLVVMEGNRRVAALKALAHPELAPTKESAIRDLLKVAGAFPREIEVLVAPDRSSVRRLLASKHTQMTRRPWRPLRQAYFYKAELQSGKTVDDLRAEYPGVEIEKFLRYINVHHIAKALTYDTPQVVDKVHNERQFPVTTVERLYDDKHVREFLGFDFDKNGELKVKIARAEFEKGFRKLIEDVVTKFAPGFGDVDSRTLNNEKHRAAYLSSFPKDAIPKRNKAEKVTTSKDFKEQPEAPNPPRTKLAPRNIQFSLQSKGVHRMLDELQKIDYHKFANATHDLLRSFLECALKSYFLDTGKPITPVRGKFVFLDQVLDEFIKEMTATNNNRLRQVAERIKSADMLSYTTAFLNATNHNPDVFATDKDVEVAWDTMEALLRFVLNPVKPNAPPSNP